MVLLHVSRSTDEFIYECKTNDSVDNVTRAIAQLHNLRLRVKRLVISVRDLAKYGPIKAESERGLNEEQMENIGKKPQREGLDPLGIRIGEAASTELQKTLNKVADEAEAAISNNLAKQRRPLSIDLINACLQNIHGATMIAYPMQLPPWDSVRLALEEKEDLSQHEDSRMHVDESTAIIWFAGKQLDRKYPLNHYVGNNEKVTIKVKLESNVANGPPSREPAIDAETQQKMIALWHKKEQENKAMAAADESEDSYLNSDWANPRGFKESMHGLGGNIIFKPGGR